jgi:allantoicase
VAALRACEFVAVSRRVGREARGGRGPSGHGRGRGILAKDEHVSLAESLTAPGRDDRWEPRQRREPGHDRAILEFGAADVIQEAIVDTAHFKGDYPDGGVSRLRLIDDAAA